MSPEKVTEIQIKDLPPKLAEETKAQRQHWFGLLLALLSGLVFTTNNVCFQWLQLSHVHLLFLRGILQSFICLFTALIKRQKIWHGCTVTQLIVILQGTAIGIILLCSYQSLHYLPLGDAMTLLFSSPLFTVILQLIVLRTRTRMYKIFWTIILLIGVIMVAKPQAIFGSSLNANLDSTYYIGIAYALAASLASAVQYISIAKINTVETNVLMIYSGVCTTIISISVGWFQWKNNYILISLPEIFGYTWIAILGLLATYGVTHSCKLADPSTVSFVRSLEIIFAFLAQYAMGQTHIHGLSMAGASLIVVSVIAKPFEEQVTKCLPLPNQCQRFC